MNKLIWLKTARMKGWVLGFLLLFILLAALCPGEEDYEAWLEKEYGISCGVHNHIDGMGCVKDGQMISRSGHTLQGLIFIKKEMEYEIVEDGTVIKVNTAGVLNTFF